MARLKLATAPRIEPKSDERLTLRDGSSAGLEDGALALRDREGRLLLRFVDGCAEISAPDGDLKLAAPNGRVCIEAATDVVLHAPRDLVQRADRDVSIAGRNTTVKTEHLAVEASASRVVVKEVDVFARAIATTATEVRASVDRYELTAKHIVERAETALQEIVDLAESRLGRARTLVRGLYALKTRRTTAASTDETHIDGKKILLG